MDAGARARAERGYGLAFKNQTDPRDALHKRLLSASRAEHLGIDALICDADAHLTSASAEPGVYLRVMPSTQVGSSAKRAPKPAASKAASTPAPAHTTPPMLFGDGNEIMFKNGLGTGLFTIASTIGFDLVVKNSLPEGQDVILMANYETTAHDAALVPASKARGKTQHPLRTTRRIRAGGATTRLARIVAVGPNFFQSGPPSLVICPGFTTDDDGLPPPSWFPAPKNDPPPLELFLALSRG